MLLCNTTFTFCKKQDTKFTAQKMKVSIKDVFIFCAVMLTIPTCIYIFGLIKRSLLSLVTEGIHLCCYFFYKLEMRGFFAYDGLQPILNKTYLWDLVLRLLIEGIVPSASTSRARRSDAAMFDKD